MKLRRMIRAKADAPGCVGRRQAQGEPGQSFHHGSQHVTQVMSTKINTAETD